MALPSRPGLRDPTLCVLIFAVLTRTADRPDRGGGGTGVIRAGLEGGNRALPLPHPVTPSSTPPLIPAQPKRRPQIGGLTREKQKLPQPTGYERARRLCPAPKFNFRTSPPRDLGTHELRATKFVQGTEYTSGSHRPRARVPSVVWAWDFCDAASLLRSPGPCSSTVICSAICDCLSINECFSI